jgi:hypothetical protein
MNTTTTGQSLVYPHYKSGCNALKKAVISIVNRPCMESRSASADTNRDVYMYLYILPVEGGERRISALLFPLLHPAHARTSSASARLGEIVLRLRLDFGWIHDIFSTCAPAHRSPPLRRREPRPRQFARFWHALGTRLVVGSCVDGVDVAYFEKAFTWKTSIISVSVKKTILISHG